MRLWKIRAAVTAAAVLALATPAAAVHAAALADGSPSAKSTVTTLLNSDVVFQVHKKAGTVVAAEGHLSVTKHSGSTWHGTFVDSMGAGASYAVSGKNVSTTADAGVFSITTHAGIFHLKSTSTTQTVTAPAKFGAGTKATIEYKAHSYTTQHPIAVSIVTRLGNYRAPLTGALTLTTDSFGYIASNKASDSVTSKFVYSVGGSSIKHTTFITSAGRYTAPNCSNDGSLRVALPQANLVWHVNAAESDSGASSCPLVATVSRSDGVTYSEASFTGTVSGK